MGMCKVCKEVYPPQEIHNGVCEKCLGYGIAREYFENQPKRQEIENISTQQKANEIFSSLWGVILIALTFILFMYMIANYLEPTLKVIGWFFEAIPYLTFFYIFLKISNEIVITMLVIIPATIPSNIDSNPFITVALIFIPPNTDSYIEKIINKYAFKLI